MRRWILRAAGVVGLVSLVLPLYLYPLAAIDPLEASPFYSHPAYMRLFLPYAAFVLVCALGLLTSRRLFAPALLIVFVASHVHFKAAFPDSIVFKPAFTLVFIVLPSLLFAMATLSALRRRQ